MGQLALGIQRVEAAAMTSHRSRREIRAAFAAEAANAAEKIVKSAGLTAETAAQIPAIGSCVMDYKRQPQSKNQLVNQSAAAIIAASSIPGELLLPYQKRWIADRGQKSQIAEKSRQAGLTWAEAARALNGSMSTAAGGCDNLCRHHQRYGPRVYRGLFDNGPKAYDFYRQQDWRKCWPNEDKDILVYVINFASGFNQGPQLEPQQPAGMQNNVVIDGAFHKDLAAILKANNA